MVNIQSNLSKDKKQYGISNIPKVLKYPTILDFDDHSDNIRNIYSYIIRGYKQEGISMLIYREPENDNTTILFGDWDGNNLDIHDSDNTLSKPAHELISKHVQNFVNIMYNAKIKQAQYFFNLDEDITLVDMQLSLNKFASPGMIEDIFKNIIKTPVVVKKEIIDDRSIEYINKGSGSYNGDLVLKPSRFRMLTTSNNEYIPLYLKVLR